MNKPPRPPRLFADPAVLAVAILLAGLLFGWPLIQVAGERGTLALYIYIFTAWTLVVALLALIGRQLGRDEREHPGSPR